MDRQRPNPAKRLLLTWLLGLALLGLELGGMVVARELSQGPSKTVADAVEPAKVGGEDGQPFRDVLLFPLM